MRFGKRVTVAARAALFLAACAALRADSSFTAALKNCTELIGFGPVDFAAARALVPASFTLVPFNGSAGLVVRASRCESVRIDGLPAKSAVVAQAGIAVIPPDGTGDINNYTLLYSTNDDQLFFALLRAGLPAVLDLALAYEFTPDSTGHGEMYAAVSPLLQPAWFLTGAADPPPPGGAPVTANWWYNSLRGTLKMATTIPSISYGAASFALHTSRSSTLGKLIGGNTDSAFVLFNARGVFATGDFAATVK
ncbi:MAG TPA: hypothetical protein VGF59_23410 [Bryobacteraceae bacterium]